MMRTHSLRGRLLGVMLAVFALGLAASLASYRFEFHNIVSDLRVRTLQAQARALAAAIHRRADGRLELDLPANWRAVYADPSRTFEYTIYDASSQQPIAWSENLPSPPPESTEARAPGGADRIALVGAGGTERAVLATHAPGGYVLVVSRGDLSRETLVDSLFEESGEHLSVLAPIALLALCLIWIVSGWSLRPVDRASREAARIAPARSQARISPEGLPREILPLVQAVNGALDRLSQAYAAERRFTADAAHELRTPLAVLTLRLERARLTGTSDWTAIERELGEMRRLVDQLLDLARKEARGPESAALEQPIVNLARLVREVAASLVPLAESTERTLQIDIPETALLRGRAEDLRDLVRNLIDNALLHGRGTVSVRLRSSRDVHTLQVCDEGAGVPLGREEAVFDRFCKLDQTVPGSGLGLAIVRQVARSHGGEARFLRGRGCAEVTLRAASGSATAAPLDTGSAPRRRAEPVAPVALPQSTALPLIREE